MRLQPLPLRSRILLVLTLVLAACSPAGPQTGAGPTARSGSPAASPSPPRAEITVAAAADLQFAFSEIAALFEQETGVRVNLVFGSTGQLVQQIENGAPFDLIAAANRDYIQRLDRQGLVLPGSVAQYAQGRIVLAVGRDSGVQAVSLEDLLSPQVRTIAIANPEHAPYGLAARQALESAGVWDALQSKLVIAENVRQALLYLQTGEADAGIVALSVANVPEITWTLLDPDLHQPLDQYLGVTAAAAQPDLALEFARYVNGRSGRPVMRTYGFILPGETPLQPPEKSQ